MGLIVVGALPADIALSIATRFDTEAANENCDVCVSACPAAEWTSASFGSRLQPQLTSGRVPKYPIGMGPCGGDGTMRLGLVGAAVAAALASCATEGRIYDRAKSDNFEIGVTTADQVLSALGPPDLDVLRPDGMRVLRWRYRTLRALSIEEHVLSANFDPRGTLIYLHNPKEGQQISPF